MVDPEHDESYIPPLEEVAAAYGDILAYNSKHANAGVAMANLIHAMIEADEADAGQEARSGKDSSESSDLEREALERQITEGDAQAEMQDMFHGGIFESVGLKVDSVLSGSITGDGRRTSSAELKPRVVNTELYTDFLKTLDKDEVQAQIPNLALQADVIGSLSETVRACFGRLPEDLTDEERDQLLEAGEDALRTFTAIEPEYERLGLDKPTIYQHALTQESSGFLDEAWQLRQDAGRYMDSYAQMGEYVNYWGRNVLPEYLEVGQELNVAVQSYYFDGMHDELATDVDYVLSLQMDDRTREFGTEVARAKAESLALTLQSMDKPGAYYASESNRKLVTEQLARLQPYL